MEKKKFAKRNFFQLSGKTKIVFKKSPPRKTYPIQYAAFSYNCKTSNHSNFDNFLQNKAGSLSKFRDKVLTCAKEAPPTKQ